MVAGSEMASIFSGDPLQKTVNGEKEGCGGRYSSSLLEFPHCVDNEVTRTMTDIHCRSDEN